MSAVTVLVVDDSRTSRMLLKAQISQQRPDWNIIEAASGDEAVALVDANPPQYVTMDVNMPGISGLEAAGKIRIHHPEVKISLCTANIQENTKQTALNVGIYFAKKPITENSVKEMITFFEG
jgi:CheY-like chemotaxis protein